MSKKKTRTGAPGPPPASRVIKVARDGDWLASDDFCEACIQAVNAHLDVHIDLEGLDHLDASALQILLALDVEQGRSDRRLFLTNASTAMHRWFEFAGASRLLSLSPAS